jgi:hypothetical protein
LKIVEEQRNKKLFFSTKHNILPTFVYKENVTRWICVYVFVYVNKTQQKASEMKWILPWSFSRDNKIWTKKIVMRKSFEVFRLLVGFLLKILASIMTLKDISCGSILTENQSLLKANEEFSGKIQSVEVQSIR